MARKEAETPKKAKGKREGRISLHPLTLTEAVRGLLGVPAGTPAAKKGGERPKQRSPERPRDES